jgi:acetyltransferase-like isoleucine patch superfamily enzyme
VSDDEPESLPDRLFEDLRRTYELEDSRTRSVWQRSLPVVEAVSDRWQRAAALGFGDGTSVYHHCYVFGSVEVGEHTWIGPNTLLDGSGGLRIGSWCSIGPGTQIYSHDSALAALSGGEEAYRREPTAIGDRCWIGGGCVIDAGVTIGSRCLLRPLTYVERDVPEGSIVAGNPGQVVGRVVVTDDGRLRLVSDSPD